MKRWGDGAPIFSGLTLFALDNGLPVWRFEVQGRVIERRLVMPYRQNTTMIRYRLLSGAPLSLTIRPWIHVRGMTARWINRCWNRWWCTIWAMGGPR